MAQTFSANIRCLFSYGSGVEAVLFQAGGGKHRWYAGTALARACTVAGGAESPPRILERGSTVRLPQSAGFRWLAQAGLLAHSDAATGQVARAL